MHVDTHIKAHITHAQKDRGTFYNHTHRSGFSLPLEYGIQVDDAIQDTDIVYRHRGPGNRSRDWTEALRRRRMRSESHR